MLSSRHFSTLWRLCHFASTSTSTLQAQNQFFLSAGIFKCCYWTRQSLQAENTAEAELDEKESKTNLSRHPENWFLRHDIKRDLQSYEVLDVLKAQKEANELKEAILKAPDPISAIEITSNNLNLSTATLCLQQISILCRNVEENDVSNLCDKIFNDSRFLQLSNFIDKKIDLLSHGKLVSCYSSLVCLTSKDIYLLKSLGTQILFCLRKMPFSSTVRILEIMKDHRETDWRQKIYHKTLSTVDKRWVELSNPKDLIKLMYMFSGNEETFFGKLEERALDLSEEMSPKNLYRVFYLLSKRKSRNTPLIRSIVYHLNKAKLDFEIVHLKNILYACCTLNVYDTSLLSKLMSDIKSKILKIENHHIATSVLMSCCTLRWLDVDLLNVILLALEKQFSNLSERDCTLIIMTLSKLNYYRVEHAGFLKNVLGKIDSLQKTEPSTWLDTVWNLAVLQQVEGRHISSVLDPVFIEALPTVCGKDAHQLLTSLVKLLNIEAVARLDKENYSGPYLPTEWHSTATPSSTKAERNLAQSVVLALSNIAPLGKYVQTDVATYGYFIDAELFVNKTGNPVPHMEGLDNPKVYKRIAFKVLDFYDMTLPKPSPLGFFNMAVRHLEKLGYTVIMVPYYEWSLLTTVVKKVQFLNKKIKENI